MVINNRHSSGKREIRYSKGNGPHYLSLENPNREDSEMWLKVNLLTGTPNLENVIRLEDDTTICVQLPQKDGTCVQILIQNRNAGIPELY